MKLHLTPYSRTARSFALSPLHSCQRQSAKAERGYLDAMICFFVFVWELPFPVGCDDRCHTYFFSGTWMLPQTTDRFLVCSRLLALFSVLLCEAVFPSFSSAAKPRRPRANWHPCHRNLAGSVGWEGSDHVVGFHMAMGQKENP